MQKLRPYHQSPVRPLAVVCGQQAAETSFLSKQQKRTLSGTTSMKSTSCRTIPFCLAVNWGILIKTPSRWKRPKRPPKIHGMGSGGDTGSAGRHGGPISHLAVHPDAGGCAARRRWRV